MQCASCDSPLGVNYLRCPGCGAKVSARADASAGVSALVLSHEAPAPHHEMPTSHREVAVTRHEVLAVPAPAALHVASGRVLLPPLPAASRGPLIVLALALCAVCAATFAGMSGGVSGDASARFDGGWDRVVLQSRFVESNWFGEKPLAADATSYTISSADGTELYRGTGPVATIDDGALGNHETLRVSACTLRSSLLLRAAESVCANTELAASAKQFIPLNMLVSYPRGGRVDQPRVAFQQALQRAAFGQQDQWVQVRVIDAPVRLKVWVADAPNEAVQLRLAPSNALQMVDLSGGDGFAAFQAAVQRAEARTADVELQFQFHTSVAPDAAAYPARSVTLQGKRQEERFAEVQAMADRAARFMVGNHYGGGRRLEVEVQEWRFDTSTRIYGANLRISWLGRDNASNAYWIQGKLAATESREKSQFELVSEGYFSPLVRGWAGISIKIGDVVRDVL